MSIKNKFNKHVFVCVNSREDINRPSCGDKGFAIRTALVKELASHPNVKIKTRINKSGCLSECQLGPAIVIYPQGFWYYKVSLSDVSEIVKKSIIENEYIERLSK